jgi:hypothetical protein
MIVRFRQFGVALALACGASASGCAGAGEDSLARQSVSGKVSLDEKPLKKGSITFAPADPGRRDAVSAGAIISEGAYTIPRDGGLTPGTYRVAIIGDEEDAAPAGLPGPTPRLSAAKKPMVPKNYNAESTLTAEVKGGESKPFDFDLKSQ